MCSCLAGRAKNKTSGEWFIKLISGKIADTFLGVY